MSELKQLPIPDKAVLDTWTDRVATNIDEIILNRIEPQLNELGWFKERTCTVDKIETDEFGHWVYVSCGHVILTHGKPSYCSTCGAKVVEHEH